MKNLGFVSLVLTGLFASSFAQAAAEPVLDCRVWEVKGSFSQDTQGLLRGQEDQSVRIDLNLKEIKKLIFLDKKRQKLETWNIPLIRTQLADQDAKFETEFPTETADLHLRIGSADGIKNVAWLEETGRGEMTLECSHRISKGSQP